MDNASLPDIQNTEPLIKRSIKQVGVENIEVPFILQTKNKKYHETIANVSIRTNLDSKTKGISMSRLIRTLRNYLDKPLKNELLYTILYDLKVNIGMKNSFIRFDFRLPYMRKSIKSNNEFPIYYKCRFEGQLLDNKESIQNKNNSFRFYQGIIFQYASYCPCSTELSKNLEQNGSKGSPHAQRSFADVLIECDLSHPSKKIWLEDIINWLEKSIMTLPYPIIKREDEQEIARIAALNPIFVEDAIRQISNYIDSIEGIKDWLIKCSHEESIHTSEAIAMNWKGVPGGFNSNYFL